MECGEAGAVLWLLRCGLVPRRNRRMAARRTADGGSRAGAARSGGDAVTAIALQDTKSCRTQNVQRGRECEWGPLFNFLLYVSRECEQSLINRGRHLTHEFDHLAPVVENPRLPNELVAHLVYFGLILGRGILKALQRHGVGTNFFRGFALFAGHPFETHD